MGDAGGIMQNTIKCVIGLALAAAVAMPASAAQTASVQTVSESTANAIREHLDEAEDLTESLLRWKHIITTVGRDTAAPEAPASTLISIERNDAKKLNDLIGAIAAQVPTRPAGTTGPKGELRDHVEKAREIARELLPNGTSTASGNLVNVDRTALQRLEIELDAIETIAPRLTRAKSH
jgi:hypothetical protein